MHFGIKSATSVSSTQHSLNRAGEKAGYSHNRVPALQVAPPRRIAFEKPIPSSCKDADGKQIATCFILAIWQNGARLRLSNSCPENFYLWFTTPG
jgi:hypothetical protein